MVFRLLRDVLIIRRMEFFIVELTIFLIPFLFSFAKFGKLQTSSVITGAVLFFVLYSFGDIINCYADRELDKTFKSRLSNAVYSLGSNVVRNLVIGLFLASTALTGYLYYLTGKWELVLLVGMGLFLGAQYSTRPFFFKSRGILHLVCLWLLLYFLPMLYASLLIANQLSFSVVALAASYATIEMGIILVNTSEDFPEDKAQNITTTTVALGIKPTMLLSLGMIIFGGLGFVGTWGFIYSDYGMMLLEFYPIVLLSLVVLAAIVWISRIWIQVATSKTNEHAVSEIKKQGVLIPIFATLIGWAGTVCAYLLLKSLDKVDRITSVIQ